MSKSACAASDRLGIPNDLEYFAADKALEATDDRRPSRYRRCQCGSNLTAAAILRLRDEGKPLPRRVVLAYGAFHAELPETSPAYDMLTGPLAKGVFKPPAYRQLVLNYLAGSDPSVVASAFPSGNDLSGFPPTLKLDSRNDRIRASGLAFGHELHVAGVGVRDRVIDATLGYLSFPWSAAYKQAIGEMHDWLVAD